MAQISVNIIDQCVAQGVPFAREYSGLLDIRSFGGAQVSRTFYARGQTGQQLLLGAYQALERQIDTRQVKMFPLVVDRSAFDRIIQAGGYISVNTGAAPEANTIPISKPNAELAMDAAACIGCGACVAACPNGSASLFTSAKIAHLNLLPQGQPERTQRTLRMVQAMDHEGFGNCTMHRECEAVCPKRSA